MSALCPPYALSGQLRREALAIGLRGGAEQAQEAAAHGFLGAKAATPDDALHGQALLEQLAGGFDADSLDRARRGDPGCPAVMANETALAHRGGIRKCAHRQVATDIVGDPGMQALEASIAMLQRQGRAELRLAARALEKDNELAGDRQGHARPEIRFDESKREVDAGRDAGRCPDIAVADEDRIGIEFDRRKFFGELRASSPVRDRAAAIEEARGRQQEGTAAYR